MAIQMMLLNTLQQLEMEVHRKRWKELHHSAQQHTHQRPHSLSRDKFRSKSKEKQQLRSKGNSQLFRYTHAVHGKEQDINTKLLNKQKEIDQVYQIRFKQNKQSNCANNPLLQIRVNLRSVSQRALKRYQKDIIKTQTKETNKQNLVVDPKEQQRYEISIKEITNDIKKKVVKQMRDWPKQLKNSKDLLCSSKTAESWGSRKENPAVNSDRITDYYFSHHS